MKTLLFLLLLSVSAIFIGCSTGTNDKRVSEDVQPVASSKQAVSDADANKDLIGDSKGVIVLSDKYSKDDFIRIYNEDGSLWHEFTYYYDDSDGKFEYEKEDFAPFSFHPDYFGLALKCVGEDAERYEVVVNEDTGLRKFLKKNDPTIKLESWEKHLLELFAVDFNKQENPAREEPDGRIIDLNFPKDVTFHPVEIKGDWMKVRFVDLEKKHMKFAWIKWNENGKFLLEVFYMA
ncbi:MAG: hypothetical protein KF685_10930 [Acidobacteria bacterium]|nr:hypothetical protein [Acidobacteriota bacterium]